MQLATTGDKGAWEPKGKFSVKLTGADGKRLSPGEVANLVAEGTVSRLVRVQLIKDKARDKNGKETYKVRIDNASSLILNGLALSGPQMDDKHLPTVLVGFSLPPRRSLTVPTSADAVERLGLKDGLRVLAADLSGL